MSNRPMTYRPIDPTYHSLTRPANPIKAIDRIPASISVMGNPRRGLGTSASSRRSLIPAIIKSASVKPIPALNPKTRLSMMP